MRTCGDMRDKITLLKRVGGAENGNAQATYEAVLTVQAAKRDMSQREFAGGSAMNYERVVIYTIRTPIGLTLTSGLMVEDADGNRYKAAQILKDNPQRGLTQLRVVGKGLEGYGIE